MCSVECSESKRQIKSAGTLARPSKHKRHDCSQVKNSFLMELTNFKMSVANLDYLPVDGLLFYVLFDAQVINCF